MIICIYHNIFYANYIGCIEINKNLQNLIIARVTLLRVRKYCAYHRFTRLRHCTDLDTAPTSLHRRGYVAAPASTTQHVGCPSITTRLKMGKKTKHPIIYSLNLLLIPSILCILPWIESCILSVSPAVNKKKHTLEYHL